jgi:membrane protease YdiL (CAAX protease family)
MQGVAVVLVDAGILFRVSALITGIESSTVGLALGLAGLSILSNLRLFPRMHIPILYAFLPNGFHLLAALILGVTAGFCEEVLFRAFLMTQFAKVGFGRAIQVLIPGLALGLAHARYLNQGFLSGSASRSPLRFSGWCGV